MFRPVLRSALFCLLSLHVFPASGAGLTPERPTMLGDQPVFTGKTVDLSLADAVAAALANNASIRSAWLERSARKTELKAAEDRFSPKLALTSRHIASQSQDNSYSQTEVTPSATLQSEYGTRFSLAWNNKVTQGGVAGYARDDGASLTIVQPLLRGAAREVVTAPVRIARIDDQISHLNLKSSVSNTVTEIVSAYNEMLRVQEHRAQAREALAQTRRQMEDDRHLLVAGYDVDVDFAQTEADLAVRELSLEEAENQFDASRMRLLRLIGLDLDTQIRATDPLETQRVRVSLAQALTAARNNQPAFLIQLAAAEQAAIRLTVARDQQQWDVSLVGGASQVRNRVSGAGGTETNRTWENHAGIQIDIPFGDTTRRQAEKRALIEASTQNNRRIEARLALERDIGDAVRNLDARWRQYELAQRAIDLATRKLDTEREKQRTSTASPDLLFAAESALRDARLARVDALVAYRNAQATLDRIQGTTLESWGISLND